ncbi:hypothetical protein BJ322DRAFT_1041709 [Thelephora terrestris]|uniref:F-box domain-containing protein n=1 Tax=Thelephora terrestris TaxID=56493 RepID=A0A9P6HKW8_9AGAM|nr:hypothetical protein BJ322DRAFT_1041709 [Thelephora terrestris]
MSIPSFGTVMPNTRLPQELTDYIIDFLHDELETLRQCCLVSRTWVSRTRKHLFRTIRFKSSADLNAWKKAFQNPLSSPTYHTRCLIVNRTRVATAILEESGRVQSFSNVVRLELSSCMKGSHFQFITTPYCSQNSLHRFHNPAILRSLQVYLFPPSSRGPGNKKRAGVQWRSRLPTFDLATVDGDPWNICGSRDGTRRTPIIEPAERLSLSETRLCVVSRG